MIRFYALLMFVLLLVACASSKQHIFEYNVPNYDFVIDSIENSGTQIGEFNTFEYVLDNDSVDFVEFAPIGRKGKITGSIQIRQKDSIFEVKIIDVK